MRTFFKKSTLCFSMVTALLLVSVEVEPWALALSILLLLFRFGAEKKFWPNLPSLVINIASVLTLGLVLAQFKTFLGQEASSTLLVVLCALRIADFKTERDERYLVLLGFVLVALKFLFSLDFYLFPIGGAVFLSLWRSLLPPEMESPWKTTLLSAIKSFPVVAILFFIFPRVQVPWLRSSGPNIPLSGMSESIAPGDISDLTLSEKTAFRAKFVGYRPSIKDLYWRGAVLEKMDGFRWNKTTEPVKENPTMKDDIASDYSVTLEPSELRVLPTLEYTRYVSSPMAQGYKTDRAVFRSNEPILSRIQYSGVFAADWAGPTIENEFQITELPPKTKAWVKEIRSKKLSFEEKVQTLKKFFAENNFSYTRQPGSYNNLDEFLFDRRLGFCEHFAGGYATLARALDIPARVVTGYQGGEWNDAGDFLRITQADAHAWAEVRNPKGKWFRVDPTYWIAPLRIELGGSTYFKLSPSDLKQGVTFALNRLREQGFINQVINLVQYQTDNLNYLWTRTMLEFDLSEQQKILKVIAPRIGWWLANIFALFFLFFVGRKFLRRSISQRDEAVETFIWLQEKFESLGFKRELQEAPIVFLESMKKNRPRDEVLINKTIQLYRYERYRERKSGPDDWDRLKRAWKKRFSEKLRDQAS
jgi:transglutaminase-like putative cysteine protease